MADCCSPSPGFLSTLSDYSTVFTAVAGLALAFYVFIYQRRKDELSHRLQWFKDLIIEPNKELLYTFFETVDSICTGFNSRELTDLRKIELLNALKTECSSFRRNFINLLSSVDPAMHREIQDSIDSIPDRISQAAFNADVNLADEADYDEQVSLVISNSKNFIFARIFRYEGDVPRPSTWSRIRSWFGRA